MDKLPERRRIPLELHVNTILTGVATAAIIGVGVTVLNLREKVAEINVTVSNNHEVYALKSDLAKLQSEMVSLELRMLREEYTRDKDRSK